jgi:hypothetical protein
MSLERRSEATRLLQSAHSHRAAYVEFKKVYRFTGSYDAVKNWRSHDAQLGLENIQAAAQEMRIKRQAIASGSDPIEMAMNLSKELSVLCSHLTALIQDHQWFTGKETRLNNRDATKILAALPSLSRASNGSILEMARLKTEMNEKALALGTLFEFGEDWRRTLEHDNPELVPLFESVLAVTKSRLELDTPSVLEEVMMSAEEN